MRYVLWLLLDIVVISAAMHFAGIAGAAIWIVGNLTGFFQGREK